MTPQAFAKRVAELEGMLRQEITIGLHEGAALIVEEAKGMIGHEHDEWPPLTPETELRKARAGYPAHAPLLATGEMRDSIDYRIVGMTATVGSNDPKAVVHEHGSDKVPPRPFLTPSAIAKSQQIAEMLAERIKRTIQGG